MVWVTGTAFQSSSKNSRFLSAPCGNRSNRKRTRCSSISMFLGEVKSNVETPKIKYDTTRIGDLDVPTVGIGTISWSSKSLTTLKNLELQSLTKEAYRSDAALFDTAERYGSHLKTAIGLGWGETEQLLQKLLHSEVNAASNYNSSKLKPVVATKFTPSPWRNTVESVVKACEESRDRLGVDQIDLYQLHMPDIVQPLKGFGIGNNKDEIYWEGLAECYKRGLVKNVGVCNYGPTLLSKCQESLAKHSVPLASNQIAYSLIGRHNGAQETVDKCNDLDIKVLAYYPFAMGLLTGKYSKKSLASLDETLVTSTKSSLEVKDLKRYADEMGPLITLMEQIAKRRGKSIAQISLNYIICKGAIPIPGARSVAQLKDNVGAMGWRLTTKEILDLENLADQVGGFEGAGFKRTSEKFVGYGVEKWRLD
jgi:pyridoxine 4-dehydrogenase